MYHYNYTHNWRFRNGGLQVKLEIGPTKYDSIFIPFIGNIKEVTSKEEPVSTIEKHSFKIVNATRGIAIIEGEDTTDRILFTGHEKATNGGHISIMDQYTTGGILAQAYAQGKKDAELAFAVLLEKGQQIVILKCSTNRPPMYYRYTNQGEHVGIDTYSQPLLSVDVMDGVEWYARLDAKALAESPEEMTFI